MTDPRQLLTVRQTAELLSKNVRWVQRAAANGDLPTVVKLPGVTGAFVFEREVIEELAQSQALAS